MKKRNIFLFIIALLTVFACTKEIDFDQIDELTIDNTLLFTLVHFDLKPQHLLDEKQNEISLIADEVEAPIKGDSQKYLEKVEFNVITENTFDRSMTFKIVFYNESNQLIYTIQPIITIPANSNTTSFVLEIPKDDLDLVFQTESFGFELVISDSLDGSQLSVNDPYRFKLKSSMKLYFKYHDA